MGMADYILGTYLYHCNALLVTAISVIRSEKISGLKFFTELNATNYSLLYKTADYRTNSNIRLGLG